MGLRGETARHNFLPEEHTQIIKHHHADDNPTPQMSEHQRWELVAQKLSTLPGFGASGCFNGFGPIYPQLMIQLWIFKGTETKNLKDLLLWRDSSKGDTLRSLQTSCVPTCPERGEPNWWEGKGGEVVDWITVIHCSHGGKMLDPHAPCMHFFKMMI